MVTTGHDETTTTRMTGCPNCGAGRVAGARDCWQCGAALPEPSPPRAPQTLGLRLPWVGVLPAGLFFLPWVIASPYGGRLVIPLAGLELALGWTFNGRQIPREPLFWLVPLASVGLAALLLLERRGVRTARLWLLVAVTAWAPVLPLLVKAGWWMWGSYSQGVHLIVRFVSGWYVLTCLAYLVAGLAAIRESIDTSRQGR